MGNKGGFTLLELMLSMAIIGIIALIITGALRLGFRSIDRGEKRIEYLERVRTSLNIIDSQIQSVVPLTFDDNGEKKSYFKGGGDTLQFSTNYSIWGGRKGFVVVSYRVETDTQGRRTLYANEHIVGMEAKREATLFEAFDSIGFEYFFKDPTEEHGKWVEQWTDDVMMPESIRINLVKGTKNFSRIVPVRVGTLSDTELVVGKK